MKKTRFLAIAMAALMLIGITDLQAQRRNTQGRGDIQKGNNFLMFLDLDENQEAQAQTFYTDMQKSVNPIELDLREKELELQKLVISDQADEAAINKKIDEISGLKAEIQKARVKNRVQLRSILTEDQKAVFDSREINQRKRMKAPKGNRECRRPE